MRLSAFTTYLPSLLAVLLWLAPAPAAAQDRLELGIMAGAGYYLGDMNPSVQFKHTRPMGGIVGRYIVTDRLAVRGVVSYAGIEGRYDASSPDNYSYPHAPIGGQLPEGTSELLRPSDIEFTNSLFDISVLAEVNFLSFDHMFRKEQTRFSPYLALGLGCTSFGVYDEHNAKKRQFVLSLPFGVGVKYKLNKLLRLGLEWTFHKTFTDQLEAVPDHTASFDPADPYKNGVHSLTHNNDWFAHLGVSLTVSLWPRKLSCNDGLRTYNRD